MKVDRHDKKKGSTPRTTRRVRKLPKLPQWVLRAVVDNFPAKAAILDESGVILYVNEAWRLFAGKQGLASQDYGVGKNYLDLCEVMLGKQSPEAEAVVAILRQVLMKEQTEVSLEFPCPPPAKQQWCKVRATRLDPPDSREAFQVLVVHQDITKEKRAEERLQELSGGLINAQEQERRRIARELHDDLNQRLAMLSIELEQLGQHLPRSADELRQRTRELWTRVHDISAEVHRLSYQLHPSKLDTLGLVAAVRSLCKEISERQVLGVEFSHRRVPGAIHKDVALCLFRVVQEGLSNAIKHSGAQGAKVELIGSPEEIHLRISDSGAGFSVVDVKEKGGLGLVSMQERLRLMGGELSIESQPGRGTRIEARVPLIAPGPLTRTES
jgi:PAS domain S-box-containing protein